MQSLPEAGETMRVPAGREVSAAAELTVEVWDVGGSQNTKQLEALSRDPSKVISNSRFLGCVEVPLANTLHFRRGTPHCALLLPQCMPRCISVRLGGIRGF